MSSAQLVGGLLVLACYLVPVAVGTRSLLNRLLSSQPRDVRALAGGVLGTALLTVPAELLGAFGQLSRWPLVASYVVLAAGLRLWSGKTPSRPARPEASRSWRRPDLLDVSGVVALAVVLAAWYVQTRKAFAHGTLGFDSLAYHLPFASLFATSGSTLDIPYVLWFLPNDFYPATSELVHALGITATKTDVLSPFVSLVWLALALLAAATAFTDRRSRLLAVIGFSTVLLMPGTYTSEAGTALADLSSAAFVVAAFVLWRRLEGSATGIALAGLAMGLAVGCKLTAAVPAFLLLVAIAVTSRRGTRLRASGTYVLMAVVSGGYWFVRTQVKVGSPLPALQVPGFPKTPHLYEYQVYGQPGVSTYQPRALLYYLERGTHLSTLTEAMRDSFGPAWWAVGVLTVLVAALGIVRLRSQDRWLSIVVLLSLVGYVVTPESAPSVNGVPDLTAVVVETKIVLPVLLLAVLCLTHLVRSARLQSVLALGLLGLLASELADGVGFTSGRWRTWPYATSGHLLAVLLAVLGIAAASAPVVRRRGVQQAAVAAGSVALVVLVFAGLPTWTSQRYLGKDLARDPAVASVFGSPTSLRIAVQGQVPSYAFWGPRLQDRVVVLGHRGPHGEFDAPLDCPGLLAQLSAERSQVVVLSTAPDVTVPPLRAWLAAQPQAALTLERDALAVYTITGRLSPASCPG